MVKPIAMILAIVLVFYLFTLCAVKYSANLPATYHAPKAKSYFLMDAMMWGH